MIVVESMFFDSDDYQVESDVIPCDSKETAKAVVEKVYNKLVEEYDFVEDDDPEVARKEWEKENVKRLKDGSIEIEGGDCGYGWIKIIDRQAVTADTVSALEPVIGNIY